VLGRRVNSRYEVLGLDGEDRPVMRGLHHIEVGAVEADSAQDVREGIHGTAEISLRMGDRHSPKEQNGRAYATAASSCTTREPAALYRFTSSTRRLLAFPSDVAFGSIGFDAPYPLVVRREASM